MVPPTSLHDTTDRKLPRVCDQQWTRVRAAKDHHSFRRRTIIIKAEITSKRNENRHEHRGDRTRHEMEAHAQGSRRRHRRVHRGKPFSPSAQWRVRSGPSSSAATQSLSNRVKSSKAAAASGGGLVCLLRILILCVRFICSCYRG